MESRPECNKKIGKWVTLADKTKGVMAKKDLVIHSSYIMEWTNQLANSYKWNEFKKIREKYIPIPRTPTSSSVLKYYDV